MGPDWIASRISSSSIDPKKAAIVVGGIALGIALVGRTLAVAVASRNSSTDPKKAALVVGGTALVGTALAVAAPIVISPAVDFGSGDVVVTESADVLNIPRTSDQTALEAGSAVTVILVRVKLVRADQNPRAIRRDFICIGG